VPPDPRLLRDLPWPADGVDPAAFIRQCAWAMFHSIVLVVLPGWMLLRMVRRRTWGMGTVLTLPLLAGLVLASLAVPVPESFDTSYGPGTFRWLMALNFAPVVVFTIALLKMVVRRRWWGLLAWAVIWAASAALWLSASLLSDKAVLLPGERYSLAGRPLPLAYGYHLAAWLYVIVYVVWGVSRLAWRRLRHRAQESAVRQQAGV